MKIFGLKNCDSCRKALKSLDGAEFIDVRADGISEDILVSAYDKFGSALINSRSTTWRQLSETDKRLPPVALLKTHPTVMKRPLILHNGEYFLGWTPAVQAALG